MNILSRNRTSLILTGCLLTTAGFVACSTQSSTTTSPTSSSTAAAPSAATSTIPPDAQAKVAKMRSDLRALMEGRRKPRFASTDKLYDAAYDAWQIFLYMSSTVTDTTHRASPVFNKDAFAKSGDVLLWQTFAHKTELRSKVSLTDRPFDSLKPDYSLAYLTPPQQGNPSARFDLWNNLDENNEIGFCQVLGQYAKQPSTVTDKTFVLYEAKANGVEYEYVRSNFPDQNDPNGSLNTARNAGMKYLMTHNNNNAGDYDDCNCPKSGPKVCLPCTSSSLDAPAFDGAIEVKAAWRKLRQDEDSTHYYTSPAIYYAQDGDNGPIKYYNDTFALIGLHIIMKLQTAPHFVFMTFEQAEETSADYRYVETGDDISGDAGVIVRQGPDSNNDRYTNHAIPPSIKEANDYFQDTSTGSFFQYYQLSGVQYLVEHCAVDDTAPGVTTLDAGSGLACIRAQDKNAPNCLSADPNYYMSNFVIESDPLLNNFSGPGFGGNPYGNCNNTVYKGQQLNMGGCKGCHGVAQTAVGSDFSFLLDSHDKPVQMPDVINPLSTGKAGRFAKKPGFPTAYIEKGSGKNKGKP